MLASLIVVSMLPQFSPRTKSTAMLFFLAALSLIVLKGVSYNNLIESTESSFFGIQGYGVILAILLLFVITAPFAHSRIKNCRPKSCREYDYVHIRSKSFVTCFMVHI